LDRDGLQRLDPIKEIGCQVGRRTTRALDLLLKIACAQSQPLATAWAMDFSKIFILPVTHLLLLNHALGMLAIVKVQWDWEIIFQIAF
jgi:hypothetical protein